MKLLIILLALVWLIGLVLAAVLLTDLDRAKKGGESEFWEENEDD